MAMLASTMTYDPSTWIYVNKIWGLGGQNDKGSSVMSYPSRECAGTPTTKSTPGVS